MAVVSSGSPLMARRKLGAELRLLRDGRGLTTEEVGAHLNCHNSKISRLELAKRACTKKDFEALMELYGVRGRKRTELEALMRRGRQRVPPWWHAYNDVLSANYAEFLAYEAEATHCREYQPLLLPALVQTSDYARAVTDNGIAALGPDQIDVLVEVRMRRQERLREENPLHLDLLITEAALRLRVGNAEVMSAQLDHLLALTDLPNVSLRVIPFHAGARGAGTGAFILFGTDGGTDDEVAFTESADARTAFQDDALTLRRLNRLFGNLSTVALSVGDTTELIARVKEEAKSDAGDEHPHRTAP
ncbi:helix-turn-helix transcriptional regulator [Streptomyces calidiresistens]|uniref:Helix-turn-helix domain-containing protein n=1 Tax=Streptomyces calidiresistens TaxID=1485586 RepID=A0A7W3SZX4_9ACTN|nr:helix-turn-helix transcriptional regulator [Streptomyces calidiresistens]MBB0228331.1 helix-turn-helix domain-containing protein [Streptomyces calidiresistens]